MNEEKFSGKADNYDKYRPSYPLSMIDWLYEKTGARTVADIGAGTGKFTVLLSKKDWKITAVEPNSDMLGKLRINAPFAEIIQAPAENTGIADGSIDLVTTATAFHWFDENAFREECKRIFTADGKLAVIFNNRIHDGLIADCNSLFGKYCGYNGHAGKRGITDGGEFLRQHYFRSVEVFTAENRLDMNKTEFIGRNLSRSYAPRETDDCFEAVIEGIDAIFEKHNKNGIVTEKYETVCYLGGF